MAKVGSLIADLGLNTARFEAGINTAGKSLKRFSRNTERSLNKINKKLGKVATGGLAILIAGLGVMGRSSLVAADDIQKMSIRLGASTEALSELRFVAEQTGVDFRTMTMGFQRMTRRVSEAAVGIGEARGALKELGISATELNKLKPEKQFEVLADAISVLGTDADKVRLAMKLFDSEGVALVQTMNNGADGIKTLRAEANKLGLTLSQDMANDAADARDAMNRMKSSVNAVVQEMTINMAPSIEAIANGLSDVVPKAVNSSIESFFALRQEGLKVLAFLVSKWGGFASMIANVMGGTRAAVDAEIKAINQRILEKQEQLSKGVTNKVAVALKMQMEGLFRDIKELEAGDSVGQQFQGFADFAAELERQLLKSSDAAQVMGKSLVVVRNAVTQIKEQDIEPTIRKSTKAMLALDDAAGELGRTLKVDIGDTSRNVFEQLADQWKQTLLNMVNAYLTSGLKDIFGTLAGGSGIVGSALSFFGFKNAVPGLATGGSFDVAGRGGTDSNFIGFRATKGENVTVTPAGKQAGGGNVIFNNSYDFTGSTLSAGEVQQMILNSNESVKADIRRATQRKR